MLSFFSFLCFCFCFRVIKSEVWLRLNTASITRLTWSSNRLLIIIKKVVSYFLCFLYNTQQTDYKYYLKAFFSLQNHSSFFFFGNAVTFLKYILVVRITSVASIDAENISQKIAPTKKKPCTRLCISDILICLLEEIKPNVSSINHVFPRCKKKFRLFLKESPHLTVFTFLHTHNIRAKRMKDNICNL